jgi:uridine kinase
VHTGVVRAETAIELIERAVAADRLSAFVVAVDGHSAAGKSTFAARLAEHLGAALIPGDDFYRVMDVEDRALLDPEQGVRWYYDWERLRHQVLVPLRNRRAAQYCPYDWHADALAEHPARIKPRPVVIVEGLFVARPELTDLVDLSVVVVTNSTTRRRRQHARADATEEWLARWDAAERWYFEHVRSEAQFDVIVEDPIPHP